MLKEVFSPNWASLVIEMVKNPSAMQETQVQSLGWEDPLEKEMATPSSILARKKSHGHRKLVGYIVHGVTKSQSNWATNTFTSHLVLIRINCVPGHSLATGTI